MRAMYDSRQQSCAECGKTLPLRGHVFGFPTEVNGLEKFYCSECYALRVQKFEEDIPGGSIWKLYV